MAVRGANDLLGGWGSNTSDTKKGCKVTREELLYQIEVAEKYGLMNAAASYRQQLVEIDQADQRAVIAALKAALIERGAEDENG